jgi:hypothetical protein
MYHNINHVYKVDSCDYRGMYKVQQENSDSFNL